VRTFSLNFFDSDSSPSWEITTNTGNANRPTERFSGLMGLDGIFRKSPPAYYGINATKGRWLNEHTFALERRILASSAVSDNVSCREAGSILDLVKENQPTVRLAHFSFNHSSYVLWSLLTGASTSVDFSHKS